MHQVLRLNLLLSSRNLLGRLSPWQGRQFQWLPDPKPHTFPPRLPSLLDPGSGQRDLRLWDSKQIFGPGYCPIIPPRVTAIQSSRAGRRKRHRREGRVGDHAQPSSTRNPKLSPRPRPVLLIGVSSHERGDWQGTALPALSLRGVTTSVSFPQLFGEVDVGKTRQGSPLGSRDGFPTDLSGDASKAPFWSFSHSLPSPGKSEIATQWSAGDPALPGWESCSLRGGAARVPQGEVMQRAWSSRLLVPFAGSLCLSMDWAG